MQLITIHADGAQRLRKHYKWPSNAIVVATITEHMTQKNIFTWRITQIGQRAPMIEVPMKMIIDIMSVSNLSKLTYKILHGI